MWRQVAPDHWQRFDKHGVLLRGSYKLSGWWFWYRCGRKNIKGEMVTVEIARGGPWPTSQLAWDEMNGQVLLYREQAR